MRGTSSRDKYLDGLFGVDELRQLRHSVEEHPQGHMSISGPEARILQFLIRGFGVKRVVEFGTFLGYSALAMAWAVGEGGEVITLDRDPKAVDQARQNFALYPWGQRVRSLCGDAVELMKQIQGPVDMVFIDANKPGYLQYLDWAEQVLRPGGLVVGDNTFLWGGVWDEPEEGTSVEAIRVMKEFNRRLSDRSRWNSVIFPTAEGMTVAQRS